MLSFGQAPNITSTSIAQQRPVTQPSGTRRDTSCTSVRHRAIKSMERPSGDTLQKTQRVQFGAHALPNDSLFQPLIEKGYHPFVANAKEDVPELVDFLKKAFRDSPIPSTKSRDERIQEFQTILQEGGYIYLIRDNKNQIVGSAVLHTDAKNLGYIRSVGVDEHHRGKKIATTMMQGLIAEAKRRHFPKVELSPETPQARALYEKLGFETYDEKLIHHQKFPVMRLYLKEPNKGWGSWLLDGIQSAANWIYGKVKAFLSGMFSFFSAKQ